MRCKQNGLTILEMLITLAISTIIAAAVLTLFSQTLFSSNRVIELGRLDGELNAAMDVIESDVQRSGYWANAHTSEVNPFDVITINPAQDCILISYDRNSDGTLPGVGSGTDDERYGFRKMGDTLQYRPASGPFDCSAATTDWDNITDPSVITITSFVVTQNNVSVDIDGSGSGTDTTQFRNITISITGNLTHDANVTRTISRTIRVYNNKYAA